MTIRTPAALFRAVLDNPVFSRQMSATLSGTKLALVFLFVNGALIASTIISIIAGIEDPGLRGLIDQAGLGLVLRAINSSVIYGLLAILLPLQAARLFEVQRLDHVFDQLVVSGVRPARLHFGNWAATMALAAVVLAATLPYQALAYAVKGVGLLDLAASYAILFAYSNVIVLVTLAIAVMVTEFLAAPLSALLFIGLGLLALTPIPTVLVFWTPVRWLLSPGSQSLHFTEHYFSGLYSSTAVFGLAIPLPALAAALWGLIILLALVVLVLGPAHRFSPGLNNFGNVILRGDRKRSRLRTLRFHLNRRVEMAFLYENRPASWNGWDWALRSLSILAVVAVYWAIFIGWMLNPQLLGKGGFNWTDMQVYTLVVGGAGLAFGLLAYGENKDSIHDRDRLGRFHLPRGGLALIYLAALLAVYIAFTYLPNALPLRAAIDQYTSAIDPNSVLQVGELSSMKEHLGALPERIGIVVIFAVNLFLLSRLVARISLTAGAARVKLIIAGSILLFIPMILVPLYHEKEIRSRTVARAAFATPMMALWECFEPNDRMLQPDRLGSGIELYWTIQGSLAGAQVLLILALTARRRRKGRGARRPGTAAPSPGVLAAGAALLLALAPMPAGAGEEFSVEIIRGFNGHGFNENFDHFLLTISRPDPGGAGDGADQVVEFQLLAEDGRPYMAPGTVLVPPGTRKQVRFAPPEGLEYRNAVNPLRLTVRMKNARRELEVPPVLIDPADKLRFLAISRDGRVPPLQPPNQSWVGIKPELLPERLEAFVGCDVVLVDASDLGGWNTAQRRALYDFLRSGGAIVFFGAIDERALAASPEWAELLAPAEPPRTEVREIAFRVHRLRNVPVVWTDGDGPAALPVLQLRSFGPGFAGYLAVDPLAASTAQRFGGPERFWKLFTDRTPTSLCAGNRLLAFRRPGWSHPNGKSILAVGAYFAIYAMALGPAMLLLFRTRRRRYWAWVYAPAVSVLFAVSAPWALRWILSEPSAAAELSVTFVGAGGEAVRHTQVQIRSSGRQEHRLAIPLEDLTVAEGSGEGDMSVIGGDPGRSPPVEVKLSMTPWGHRGLYLISRGAAEPAAEVHGRVIAQGPGKPTSAWQCEVEGLKPGTDAAWIQIYTSAEPGRVQEWSESIAGWINPLGPAKGTINAGSRPHQSIPLDLRVTRTRAFLFWSGVSSAAVESPDIITGGELGGGRQTYFVRELEVVNPEEKSDTR